MYSIHELIKNRWSPRAFSEKPVEKEKIESLFEAAGWAASSFNEQPWRFIYATKETPEAYKRLFNCLVEFNQQWVQTAPVIVLAAVKRAFSRNNKSNAHARHDLGLAVGNLSLQATYMGLYVHQMAGFSPEKARKAFNISEDFEPVTMIAIGYKGNPEILPEDLKQSETSLRERKPVHEISFLGTWKED